MSTGRTLAPLALTALVLGGCMVAINPVNVANDWLPHGIHISQEGTLTVYMEGVRVDVLAPEGLTGFPLAPGVYGPGDIDDFEAFMHEHEHHVQLDIDDYWDGTEDDAFKLHVNHHRVRLDGLVLSIGSRVYGAVEAGDDVVIAADYVTVNGYLRRPQATQGSAATSSGG